MSPHINIKNGAKYAGKWHRTDHEWKNLVEYDRVIFNPHYELMYISNKILDWYINEEMGVIIIHGQTGYGKSSYAGICCAEVYGYYENLEENPDKFKTTWEQPDKTFYYDWDAAKKHIVFTPREFVELNRQTKIMDRMIWWDDAGYHLNALDYSDRLIKKIGKWMELGRSKYAGIVLTCSDLRQVLSKIRDIPHVSTIKIIKGATPSRGSQDYKSKKDRRLAKIHRSWVTEDLKKSGKEREFFDVFDAHLPGEYNPYRNIKKGFYGWYKPYRDSFEKQATDDIADELEKRGL